MPSKRRQLWNLALHIVGWLLWLPMAGSLRHDRTYGDLKRLRFRQAAGMLVPLAVYTSIGVWAYLFFPRGLVPLAGSVYVAGILLGGSLILSTVAVNQIIKRQHRSQ